MSKTAGCIDVTLDFESFYDTDYTLRRMTTAEYIRDLRFKLYMCGVQINDGAPRLLVGMDQMTSFFALVPWDQVNLIGHNLRFDGAILAWIFGHRPRRYHDTLSMARAVIGAILAKHDLNSVATHLGIGGKLGYDKGEAEALAAVKGVYNPTPEQLDALGHYCAYAPNSDIRLTRQVYLTLAQYLPEPEYELIDWTIRMFTEPVLELDSEKLRMYEQEVREHKAQLVKDTGWPKTNFTSNDKFAAMLKMKDVDPPKKWSPTTGKSTWAFSKSDLDFVMLGEEHPDAEVRDLVNCRLEVKSSIEETRAKTLHNISQTGNMPVPINYSGALNTHRLSGGDGYNVQNFKRGGTLRKSIHAPEGKCLLVADLSGIELRVATALVGDVARTEMLRNGEDLYCDTATSLFGKLVVPEGHELYTKPMKEHRLVGKVSELSLGYQSGAFTFRGMLRQMGGLRWSDEQCAVTVEKWRLHHPDHVNAWALLQKSLQTMIKGEVPGNWNIPTANGEPVFWFERDAIVLPRGLRIKYPNIRYEWFEQTVGDKTTRKRQMVYDDARAKGGMAKIYGGKVLENLCVDIETLLPTSNGVKKLKHVTAQDKVWDGIEWVSHDGFVAKGRKPVVEAYGVHMTPDHEVLTTEGWRRASQSEGLDRAPVRLPDGYDLRWDGAERAQEPVEPNVRLWSEGCEKPRRSGEARSQGWYTTLRQRVFNAVLKHQARHERAPSVRSLGLDESAVLATVSRGVQELRREGDNGLRSLARKFRELLGGHGGDLRRGVRLRSRGQQCRVLKRELPLGVAPCERVEQAQHSASECAEHAAEFDYIGAVEAQRHSTVHAGLQAGARMPATQTTVCAELEVGDLINCGPRSRFTVYDKNGDPLIVHNCQALATNIYLDQVRLINRHWPVKMSVHDEVILCGTYEEMERAMPFVKMIMKTPPTWWPNLPLDVEGDIARVYGEAK